MTAEVKTGRHLLVMSKAGMWGNLVEKQVVTAAVIWWELNGIEESSENLDKKSLKKRGTLYPVRLLNVYNQGGNMCRYNKRIRKSFL